MSHLPVLIFGTTGEIGQKIQKLIDVPVKWATRRPLDLKDTVLADLSKPDINIKGCKTLFLCTAAVPDQLEQNKRAIDAAVAAGYEWIIRVSASDAQDESNVPWVTAHAAADRYLQSKNIQWTILKPSAFMSNITDEAPAIRKGFLPQISGDGKAAWVDTKDIARVACQLFRDGPAKHASKTYILTGPELISAPMMAKTLSKYHRVRYLHLPDFVFWIMLWIITDKWTADGLVAQFGEIVRPGLEGIDVSDDIESITGGKPTSFAQFVEEHRKEFEGFDILPYLVGLLAVFIALVTVYTTNGITR